MIERGRDKFRKFKPMLNILSSFFRIFPSKLRKKLLVHYRMKKGNIGIALRYSVLKTLCKHLGDNVSIHEGVYIFEPQNLCLGNNVSIHPMCYIDATGGIEVGNDVSIAHGVTIMSTSHNFHSKDIPIKDQGVKKSKVVINHNVWLGAKATILCGISIGAGAVIGANSVVTHPVEENTINVGAPSKAIKER